MGNQLDETDTSAVSQGRDTGVIAKQLPVTVGPGSLAFEIILWVLAIIPGLIFLYMKVKARNYFNQLEQRIQHNASQIDNYLEQRVIVLENCAQLVTRAVDLDKSTFENIAKYRARAGAGDENKDAARNEMATEIDRFARDINVAVENYPELRAHDEIRDAMKQNMYLQKEITAAREVYNDTVNTWNRELFKWPTNQIVAARAGLTTRIPFAATAEVKERARQTFF